MMPPTRSSTNSDKEKGPCLSDPELAVAGAGNSRNVSVLLLDASNWRILDINHTAVRRLGCSIDALTRMKICDLDAGSIGAAGGPQAACKRNAAIVRELHDAGRVIIESAYRCRDGRNRPIEVTLSMHEHRGRKVVLAAARDISARKRILADLDQAASQLSLAADVMGVPMGIQNANGILRYVNTNGAEMLGYDRNELIGRPVSSLLEAHSRQVLRRQVAKRRYGIMDRYEMVFVTKAGQSVPAILSPVPLFADDGSFRGTLGTMAPATGRLGLEQHWGQYANELRHLVERGPELLSCVRRLLDLIEPGRRHHGPVSRSNRELGHSLDTAASKEVSSSVALPGATELLAELTPRERQIVEALAEGTRVLGIAKAFGLSPRTIRNHLKSVFRKLRVGSQVELLARMRHDR